MLRRPQRVVFTVNQVSPSCVGIGHFIVAGHAGRNRIRFAGRVQGQQLSAGTYRISIRTASGRVVRRITLVIVAGAAPSRDELNALRAANTCGAQTVALFGTTFGTTFPIQASPPTAMPLSPPQQAGPGFSAPRGPNLHSGVLGSTAEKTVRAIRPALVALLALSILLLGVASLPGVAVGDARVNDLLARHRLELAGLGAAALVAVAISFLLA